MFFLPTRILVSGFAIMLIVIQATAQKPVKVDLITCFDQLVIPPVTAMEAYRKTGCSSDAPEGCNADIFYTKLKTTFDTFQKELTSPETTTDLVKQAQSPEFQKKMESINTEEKMKTAMQMAGSMQKPAPMTAEPPGVITTMEDIGKINEDLGNEDIHRKELASAELQYMQNINNQHSAIEDWQTSEIAKLPVIHGKTGDYPDPTEVHHVKLLGMEKHLKLVDRDMQTSIMKWKKDVEKEKLRYNNFSRDLQMIHFGDDAANDVSRNTIATMQTRILSSLQILIARSNTIWNNAVDWYKKKIALDREKY